MATTQRLKRLTEQARAVAVGRFDRALDAFFDALTNEELRAIAETTTAWAALYPTMRERYPTTCAALDTAWAALWLAFDGDETRALAAWRHASGDTPAQPDKVIPVRWVDYYSEDPATTTATKAPGMGARVVDYRAGLEDMATGEG